MTLGIVHRDAVPHSFSRVTETSQLQRVRPLDPPELAAVHAFGERILVVDDEPDITALVAYHLARAGFRVSTAATGTDALRAVHEERPALVVLDRMLPGTDGDEVLAQLRSDPAARDVAVIMLTAFKLLLILAQRRGRVQGRGQLLEDVWDASPDVQTRTVDMHVQRLRVKLGAEGELIETIRGFGYRLRIPSIAS